jgi:hypothetical protein
MFNVDAPWHVCTMLNRAMARLYNVDIILMIDNILKYNVLHS